MSTTSLPLKNPQDRKKALQKKSDFVGKQLQLRINNPRQLRIVQSMKAGRVRGGHSFH